MLDGGGLSDMELNEKNEQNHLIEEIMNVHNYNRGDVISEASVIKEKDFQPYFAASYRWTLLHSGVPVCTEAEKRGRRRKSRADTLLRVLSRRYSSLVD